MMASRQHTGIIAVAISVIVSITYLTDRHLAHRHALNLIRSQQVTSAFTDSLQRVWTDREDYALERVREIEERMAALEMKKGK
jgi:hypothetical protein